MPRVTIPRTIAAAGSLLLVVFTLSLGRPPDALSEPGETDINQADFVVQTADQVFIRGTVYTKNNEDVIIYCHSLLGSKNGSEVHRLLRAFMGRYDLITFNFRGHKSSFGLTTAGGEEILDLRAVMRFATRRGYEHIVVIGAGMGGSVGLRTSEIFGNMDALIVISPSGFSPGLAPFLVKVASDKTLESMFGKVPLRIISRTRVGLRYSAGYPADMIPRSGTIPLLILHSEKDRFANLERVHIVFEGLTDHDQLLIVPGKTHGEDLINDDTLRQIRAFLDTVFLQDGTPDLPKTERSSHASQDSIGIMLTGDIPFPQAIILDELYGRLAASRPPAPVDSHRQATILRHLREFFAIHGYTRVSLSAADSESALAIEISVPKTDSIAIHGNRWVATEYIRHLLGVSHEYFNAYELDKAIRRVASEPAIRTVQPTIVEGPNGNIHLVLGIVEEPAYRFLLATKFTDIDDFVGIGFRWNEFNPTGLQYEGRAMLGMSEYDFLTSHSISKNLLGQALRLSVAGFDMIKSRDDLEYVFSRQEVHEIGGEFAARYRVSSSIGIELGGFAKEYELPSVNTDLPVEEGTAVGARLKVDLSGRLPLQRDPRFEWQHTLYCQKTGPWDTGDFSFDTYQLNLSGEFRLFKHHRLRTAVHGGWLSGNAPPQEHFSLGGMTTLPAYPDDALVGTRFVLFGQSLCLSARSLVQETSIWHPLQVQLHFDAGTVWNDDERFDIDSVRMSVGLELDYLEVLRTGIAWPVGRLRTDSPRAYIGWGVHVL